MYTNKFFVEGNTEKYFLQFRGFTYDSDHYEEIVLTLKFNSLEETRNNLELLRQFPFQDDKDIEPSISFDHLVNIEMMKSDSGAINQSLYDTGSILLSSARIFRIDTEIYEMETDI
jgi:hypothetical protein